MDIDFNKENGFVKLHRSLLNWEWYQEPNVMRLFIHCLLRVNHAEKKWQGKIIKKGSFITSIASLTKELKMSNQQIRTALEKLQLTNEITCKPTSRYTYITVNNWEKYQDEEIANNIKGKKPKNINDVEILRNVFNNSYLDKKELMPEAEKWLLYMSEKGKKYDNKKSIETFVKKLIDLSGGNIEKAKEIINYAISQNWNSVFPIPIKEENKQNNEAERLKKRAYYESLARSN